MSVAEVQELETVLEAAKLMKVSRSKVYGMMEAGELGFVKLGKCRRIPRSEIAAVIERSTIQRSA